MCAGAGLEFLRRVLEHALLEGHVLDHAAAALPRRHRFQLLGLAVEHADAGRAEHLVAGQHVEIGAERLHVDRHVTHGLGAVDQHTRAVAMRHLDHVARGRDGAERVGDMGEGDDARLRIEQRLVFVEQDVAAIVDRGDAERGALRVAEHLPRHDIRVMFEIGDDHLVALVDIPPAPGLGHEIDRLGRAAHPDDAVVGGRVEEAADFLARRFEGIGGAGGERMRRAVHVRVLARIEMRKPVDHGLRLLRGGGVVEPDQRPAVDIFLQDREIAAEDMRVELARPRDRRQSELRPMLRRQRVEIERLTGQAIGQGRCLRGRAQALVEEIIALARVGGAETRSDQRFTCIGCGGRWRAGEADRSDGVSRSRRPSWPRRGRRGRRRDEVAGPH